MVCLVLFLKVKDDHVAVLIYITAREKKELSELAGEYGLSFSRFLVLSALGKLKTNKKGDL